VILVLINILLPSLGLSILGINPGLFSPLAAWSELLISLLGFYTAGAIFLNSYFGRTLLPWASPSASSTRARPNKPNTTLRVRLRRTAPLSRSFREPPGSLFFGRHDIYINSGIITNFAIDFAVSYAVNYA